MSNKNYLDDLHKDQNGNIIWDIIIDCEITKRQCMYTYKDPDEHSDELYDDMVNFIKKQIENYGLNSKMYSCEKKKEKTILIIEFGNLSCTTDYIGPSRCARYKNNNLNDQRLKNEIVDILLKTRVLGGHVFWPHEQPSINQYKGKSFKDRIDIILHLIKNNYETPNLLKKMNMLHIVALIEL